jgi:hypothetical protein
MDMLRAGYPGFSCRFRDGGKGLNRLVAIEANRLSLLLHRMALPPGSSVAEAEEHFTVNHVVKQ